MNAPRPAKWGWPDSSKTIVKSIYLRINRGEGCVATILAQFWLVAALKAPPLSVRDRVPQILCATGSGEAV
jgi:hypothetical protein